jgi:hypothetical protein
MEAQVPSQKPDFARIVLHVKAKEEKGLKSESHVRTLMGAGSSGYLSN